MRHQSEARVEERRETDQCLVWFWFGKRAVVRVEWVGGGAYHVELELTVEASGLEDVLAAAGISRQFC